MIQSSEFWDGTGGLPAARHSAILEVLVLESHAAEGAAQVKVEVARYAIRLEDQARVAGHSLEREAEGQGIAGAETRTQIALIRISDETGAVSDGRDEVRRRERSARELDAE